MESYIFAFLVIFVNFLGEAGGTYNTLATTAYGLLNPSVYNKRIQPDSITRLYLRFSLMTLNEINVKEQSMSVTGYLTLVWIDSRLNFQKVAPNLSSIAVNPADMWTPSLIVQNGLRDVDPIYSSQSPALLYESGKISWSIVKIFDTSCDIDSTYYPFDVQTCTISFTSWGTTSDQVAVQDSSMFFESINTKPYQENGVWTLEHESYRSYTERREIHDYQCIDFTFKFKRRSQFYILIMMIPVCLLSCLGCAVFLLPPDSGEKVGFSLTVLLSFAVYLSLISDNLPETSLTLSILTVYVTMVFSLGILFVLMTIMVLTCHHSSEDEPISSCFQRLTFLVSKIIFWKSSCHCPRKKSTVRDVSTEKSTVVVSVKQTTKETEDAEVSAADTDRSLSWQEVALIWDRFFLYLSLALVFFITLGTILWLVVPEKK